MIIKLYYLKNQIYPFFWFIRITIDALLAPTIIIDFGSKAGNKNLSKITINRKTKSHEKPLLDLIFSNDCCKSE